MIALVPMVAAVLGALVYGFSGNPKAAELGRLIFGAAILVLLLNFAGRAVHLF